MDVKTKKISEIEIELNITFDYSEVDSLADKKLQDLSKDADLKGFRKGKVPISVLKSKYYSSCQYEALTDRINENYVQALIQQKINPVNKPEIKPSPNKDKKKYSFTALVQIIPEIKLCDLSKINIINPNLIISKEEVDKSIENLRSSYTIWSPSEKKAKKGDRLKVNFKGKVNNEDFPNNEAKDFHVILGSNQLIPGFEDGLVGASKGEKLDLKVKFPDDYHADNLKGKNAVFDTEVLEVENGDKPKIDKEFLKNFGIEDGTKKDLEKKIEDGMRLDCENIIENYIKKQAIEELVSKNKFKIPSSLVEDEQKRIENDPSSKKISNINEEATKRVSAGLIMREIINQEKIEVSQKEIDDWIEKIARNYNPDEVRKYYSNNSEAMNNIQSVIVEKKTIDFVKSQASVKNKDYSFEDLMQLI